MAKPKQPVKVEIISRETREIRIWIDNPHMYKQDVLSIEGVHRVLACEISTLTIQIDARYDTDEVAREIEDKIK